MPDSEFDSQFTPEEHLGSDLGNLVMAWRELGIDPDAFITCAACGHNVMLDEDDPDDDGPLGIACRCTDDS